VRQVGSTTIEGNEISLTAARAGVEAPRVSGDIILEAVTSRGTHIHLARRAQNKKRILWAAVREWWLALPVVGSAVLSQVINSFRNAAVADQYVVGSLFGLIGLALLFPFMDRWFKKTHDEEGLNQNRATYLVFSVLSLVPAVHSFRVWGPYVAITVGVLVFCMNHFLWNQASLVNPTIFPLSGDKKPALEFRDISFVMSSHASWATDYLPGASEAADQEDALQTQILQWEKRFFKNKALLPRDLVRASLQGLNTKGIFFGGELIGYIFYEAQALYSPVIHRLFLRPSQRLRGIGRRVFRYFLGSVMTDSDKKILWKVLESDLISRRFLEGHGFRFSSSENGSNSAERYFFYEYDAEGMESKNRSFLRIYLLNKS
jgi:GNAT superfamily N-acetyltransferase